MPEARLVVVGVGNPYRGDDGVGPAVLDRLGGVAEATGAALVPSDGEPTRLVEAWEGADLAVVVDAVRTGAAPVGTVHRWELAGTEAVEPAGVPDAAVAARGTHDLGLAHALALAGALGRLPARLVVYGVEGAAFGLGDAMSSPVAAAVAGVAAAVAGELQAEVPLGRLHERRR